MTMYVDNTLLSAFATCETKGAIRHVLGYRTDSPSAPLRLGTAIHLALASHLSGASGGTSFAVFEDDYRLWAQENLAETDARCWSNVSQIVSHWLLNHPVESLPYEPVAVGGKLIVEQPVTAELAPGIAFVGTLDALVRDKATGAVYVLDHKTTTWDVTPQYEKQFILGSQLAGYLWLGQQLEQQLGLTEPIAGALINALQIRKIPASTRKCPIHGRNYAECGLFHIGAQLLGPYNRTTAQINAWLRQARQLAGAYARAKDERIEFAGVGYRPEQQGMFNGACPNCEFFPFCRKGRPWGELERTHTKDPWQPWAKLERGEE